VRSARFAGVVGPDKDAANNARLLRELADVPSDLRSARFRCALVFLDPTGRRFVAQGVCEGRIADAPRGEGGFGYDPLFLVEDGGQEGHRTMAELPAEEKNRISHRARALVTLTAALARGRQMG
jgi:XTP/dITP diphosphohydrolase